MNDNFARIGVFFKYKNKKNLFKIVKELSVLLVIKKEIPFYYFAKYLYKKNISNYKDFLSSSETRHIIKAFSPEKKIAAILDNKLDFAAHATRHKISTPKTYGYNIGDQFFINDKKHTVKDQLELVSFFEKLFQIQQDDAIFIKPMSGGQGRDCHILRKDSITKKLEGFGPQLFTKPFIFQKIIAQHEKINAINPNSINTLRIDSYINTQGEPELLSAFMRFGIAGSIQDNASTGGFCVPISLEKGTLGPYGEQLMKYGGEVFTQHPNTGYLLNGFEIPFFQEACALVKKGCLAFNCRILGWDIAVTPNGPIVIEANHNLALFISDKMYGGLKKHPLFDEIQEVLP
ncbi:sugar-transfer associated ATP-grasp domain-containing protein [Spongiimicrobium salis]|uniref:sugar-transfer associated ATP-grasp domain-containing protein n=1 Tax=Spongiimicrobium salis TaxID=1667022 RepID=UPI00374D3CD0